MTVETSLGISSNVSIQPRLNRGQPEVNMGIVPEPGQNVIARSESSSDAAIFLEPGPPFVLSLRQSVPVLAESVLRRLKVAVVNVLSEVKNPRGSARLRGRGGRRPRCPHGRRRDDTSHQCGGGISGSSLLVNPAHFTIHNS